MRRQWSSRRAARGPPGCDLDEAGSSEPVYIVTKNSGVMAALAAAWRSEVGLGTAGTEVDIGAGRFLYPLT